MGSLDREFLRKKALVQKKLEDRERHRRQEAEERVTREEQAILLSKSKNNIYVTSGEGVSTPLSRKKQVESDSLML